MDVETRAGAPRTDLFPPPESARGPGLWASTVRQDYRELVRFWPVVHNMVVQELRVKYQRSMLGFLWTLLNPILMMTTLTLVFSQLLGKSAKETPQSYAIYLFAGMVPWGFLGASLTDSAFCIIMNESLIRKIYVPKLVFPISRVLINLSTFLLSMSALFILLGPLGVRFSVSLAALPLVIALLFAFTLGLGMVVATANTFYRDFGHLVSVFLQAWYFATPIIYPMSQMPEDLRWRFWLNPAFPFIRMFQLIIREGQFPPLSMVLVAAAYATASLGIGYVAFKSHENKLVFRL